jgi:hypothetical protein
MTKRIVEVEWEDSTTVNGWHHEEDIPGVDPIVSVGHLHHEDESELVLVQSMNLTVDGPRVRTAKLSESLIIPRSAIRKVTELRRGRVR